MEEQEKIDRYLNGDMSSSERQVFEIEMEQNEELAKQIEFHEGLVGFFNEFEPELESTLEKLGEQHFVAAAPIKPSSSSVRSKKWLWLILGFLVCVCAMWIFLPNNESITTTKQSQNTIEAIEQEQISTESEIVPETEPIQDDNVGPENIKIIEPPSQDIIIDDEPVNIKEQPIASLNPADFKQNSTLESILKEQVRDEGFSTSITKPTLGQQFKNGKTIPLSLEGMTKALPPYELVVYSNRSTDFDNDYKTLSVEINSTKKIKDKYPIKFKANIPLENGLYYWILRVKESEEILHISKFTVK